MLGVSGGCVWPSGIPLVGAVLKLVKSSKDAALREENRFGCVGHTGDVAALSEVVDLISGIDADLRFGEVIDGAEEIAAPPCLVAKLALRFLGTKDLEFLIAANGGWPWRDDQNGEVDAEWVWPRSETADVRDMAMNPPTLYMEGGGVKGESAG